MKHKAWCSTEEVPYCFSRSSIKFEGHMDRKSYDLNPIFSKITRLVAAIKSRRFALFWYKHWNTLDLTLHPLLAVIFHWEGSWCHSPPYTIWHSVLAVTLLLMPWFSVSSCHQQPLHLIMLDKWVLVFHKKWFQLPVPYQCGWMLQKCFYCCLLKMQLISGWAIDIICVVNILNGRN